MLSSSSRGIGAFLREKSQSFGTELRQTISRCFVGGGVATTGAAVSAGLAVAALSRRVAPPGTIDVGARLGRPPLPSRDVVLHANVTDKPTKSALKSLAATIRATAS